MTTTSTETATQRAVDLAHKATIAGRCRDASIGVLGDPAAAAAAEGRYVEARGKLFALALDVGADFNLRMNVDQLAFAIRAAEDYPGYTPPPPLDRHPLTGMVAAIGTIGERLTDVVIDHSGEGLVPGHKSATLTVDKSVAIIAVEQVDEDGNVHRITFTEPRVLRPESCLSMVFRYPVTGQLR